MFIVLLRLSAVTPPDVVLRSRFFFDDPAPTEIYTLSLHDALPISRRARSTADARRARSRSSPCRWGPLSPATRSEEHTSELQSQSNLVCRLLLEKKKQPKYRDPTLSNPTAFHQIHITRYHH